jgi:hypothetical protein
MFSTAAVIAQDNLAEYPVRWKHGATTDFGKLVFNNEMIIFKGDEGIVRTLPYLYLDELRIVDEIWIQARSNRETGVSFGLDDVYNFGVIGSVPDPGLVSHVNNRILEVKEERIINSAKLPGEIARYMVSKGETIGDDVGLLIIAEDKLYYFSDTGGKNHEWLYSDLRAIEVDDESRLHVRTNERSIIKAGLSYRNYAFVSHTIAFRGADIGFLIDKVREARQ